MLLAQEEKLELMDVMEADNDVAENPDLMTIAIEFRLKPLIQQTASPDGKGRKSTEGESKAFKQLRQDCQALVAEHPTQVCFTMDPEKVN